MVVSFLNWQVLRWDLMLSCVGLTWRPSRVCAVTGNNRWLLITEADSNGDWMASGARRSGQSMEKRRLNARRCQSHRNIKEARRVQCEDRNASLCSGMGWNMMDGSCCRQIRRNDARRRITRRTRARQRLVRMTGRTRRIMSASTRRTAPSHTHRRTLAVLSNHLPLILAKTQSFKKFQNSANSKCVVNLLW